MKFHDRGDAGRRLAEKLRHLKDKKPVVLALPRGGVPVAAEDTIAKLRPLSDEVVCVEILPWLEAIGFYYRDFHQVSDTEVIDILARAAPPAKAPAPEPPATKP